MVDLFLSCKISPNWNAWVDRIAATRLIFTRRQKERTKRQWNYTRSLPEYCIQNDSPKTTCSTKLMCFASIRIYVSLRPLATVLQIQIRIRRIRKFLSLPDPAVSVSRRYGSDYGSGSFHQAKIVRKTFISTVLWLLYDFLPLETDVNVPSKSN